MSPVTSDPSPECLNRHHDSRFWERVMFKKYPVMRCKICKRFIGYIVSDNKKRKLKTEAGEEIDGQGHE